MSLSKFRNVNSKDFEMISLLVTLGFYFLTADWSRNSIPEVSACGCRFIRLLTWILTFYCVLLRSSIMVYMYKEIVR